LYQPPDHQRRVDEIQAAIRQEQGEARRPLFKPAPASLAASQSLLDRRLAEELEFLRRRLEAIGAIVSNDPILLVRYSAAVQDIDLMSQTLGHLSKVVEAQDKQAAAERISLGELKARLTRKPVTPIAR